MAARSAVNMFYLFCATVFLSAFLLFQIQPLIGKYILPWYGGTPAVWTVCMLFFQVLLFFGYAYAHAIVRLLSRKRQVLLHTILLAAALLWLPIQPSERFKPSGGESPSWQLLLLLSVSIGWPYFLLSATGPLLQAWYAGLQFGRSPYRLYSLSNLGSLLALVSYPFLVEPSLGADQQIWIWSAMFLVFIVGCVGCGLGVWRSHAAEAEVQPVKRGSTSVARKPGWSDLGMWFALAMLPSVMLLATTERVCTDLAVMPFLWVMPLTLYLLSFIICFHSQRWCPRPLWTIAWAIAVMVTVPVMYKGLGSITSVSIPAQISVYFSLLFCGAMVCHGELVRRQPDPEYLTSFYLTLAAGGAAGGLFVGLLAPILFTTPIELSLAIVGCTLLLLIVFYRDPANSLAGGRPRWAWLLIVVALLSLTGSQVDLFRRSLSGVRSIERNFFGVLQVKLAPDTTMPGEYICGLIHGRTMHGIQYTAVKKRAWPTSYYGEDSGIGLLLNDAADETPRRVGVVGLGVGTLATYARPGDQFRFYEINPAVINAAKDVFLYLEFCQGTYDIVAGDARLRLADESPQNFDVLVLDAFSSDAIPVHLLTREAFAIYLSHLAADGILAVHVSNMHMDLKPVLAGHADHFGLEWGIVSSDGDERRGTRTAVWGLLSRDPKRLRAPNLRQATQAPDERRIQWTDRRSSLFQVLKPS